MQMMGLLGEKHTFFDGKYKERNRGGEILMNWDLCLQEKVHISHNKLPLYRQPMQMVNQFAALAYYGQLWD